MDIIGAYKKAKYGQAVRSARCTFIKQIPLKQLLSTKTEEELCASDWEVVKEKKTVVDEYYVVERTEGLRIPKEVPLCTHIKATFEWEE